MAHLYTWESFCPKVGHLHLYVCRTAWATSFSFQVSCLCLSSGPEALALLAPECGSWGRVCRGTTDRTLFNPLGCALQFVADANKAIARPGMCRLFVDCVIVVWPHFSKSYKKSLAGLRLVLLILVLECNFAVWILEQPSGSNDILPLHPRMNWLANEILYVTRLQQSCWHVPSLHLK